MLNRPNRLLDERAEKKSPARHPLIAGNWKMHKTLTEAVEFAMALDERCGDIDDLDIALCAPFPLLSALGHTLKNSRIKVGAQNCYWEKQGAYTGEVSAPMLDSVGHSERRQLFGETDTDVNRKIRAALDTFLTPIVCVGETLEQREADQTEAVLREQIEGSLKDYSAEELLRLVIAYEPVWAIGTGRTATPHQANDAHQYIRGLIKAMHSSDTADRLRILYGGSVKPDNVRDLMRQKHLDGALVGGASLDLESFEKIVRWSQQEKSPVAQGGC